MNDYQEEPAGRHRRPEGVDDLTIEALASLSKALETTERARGHLYSFHQLTGGADLEVERAVRLLREAGHAEWATKTEAEILGRDVIPGHWTFQIVEAYDDTYYAKFKELEARARHELADGKRHLYEAELKEQRRSAGEPAHEAHPRDVGTA
jgi:hypothetical protein